MAQSNIFEAGAAEVLDLFADFFEGGPSRIAIALGSAPLGNDARSAVGKSLESFGYGGNACTFASISAQDQSAEGADVQLDPQSLFLLIEALDPLLVIVADENAARMVARAYRAAFDPDAATRIFGRPSVIFKNLESLLTTQEGKQKAWSLLKTLPKR